MKRILLCMSLIMASAFATVAYADTTATYDDMNNSVSSDIEGIKTVLVTKAGVDEITGDSIYYVDQAESGEFLTAAAGFAMKANPEAGTYNLILGFNELGSGTTEAQIIPFTIGEQVAEAFELKTYKVSEVYTDSNGISLVNVAFVTEEAVDLSKYTNLSLTYIVNEETKTMSHSIKSAGYFNDIIGKVKLGIQVNNIPAEYKDTIGLAFTNPETVTE